MYLTHDKTQWSRRLVLALSLFLFNAHSVALQVSVTVAPSLEGAQKSRCPTSCQVLTSKRWLPVTRVQYLQICMYIHNIFVGSHQAARRRKVITVEHWKREHYTFELKFAAYVTNTAQAFWWVNASTCWSDLEPGNLSLWSWFVIPHFKFQIRDTMFQISMFRF